ncbi:MAG TPA: GGDEF domain-containing protein [Acidobacteriaceae bacterium]|nr:GGDEF domain-containing protein [Acidobacteriaceae bacterium]
MRDSSGSSTTAPPHFMPADAAGRRKALPRTLVLTGATVAAVIICFIHGAVASADTARAAGIGYLCDSLILFGCGAALWTRERSSQGALRMRWFLFAAAALAEAIGYLPSFTELVLHTGAGRPFGTASFNASEALYILATVLFFAGVARSVVVLDLLQALVFVVLRFNLVYSPLTRDHFTHIHLAVGQSVALFLFLVTMLACLGAASRAELKFLRTLSWFFGFRLVAFFTADQVSYIWLHHKLSSVWDVTGDVLFGSFALYLLYTSQSARAEAREQATLRHPSLAVRSLMPSVLALVNLMLGLFLLRISLLLAAVAISVTLISYVVRTAMLHAQAVEERAALESRNEQLEGLAIRDPLTGIGNRRSLADVYSRLQDGAGDCALSILLMDIDSFKKANDCHGHLHGDKVLVTLARKLESLGAGVVGSHCARLGGDEFALLLPGVAPDEASRLAEELRSQISEHVFGAETGRVSLSVGIASLGAARDLPLETLVSYADTALYRAKLLGRDRVEKQPVWEPGRAADPAGPGLVLELQSTVG